jgi:hypothetical protein
MMYKRENIASDLKKPHTSLTGSHETLICSELNLADSLDMEPLPFEYNYSTPHIAQCKIDETLDFCDIHDPREIAQGKRVRFRSDCAQSVEVPINTEEDKASKWYSRSDLEYMKYKARTLSEEIHQRNSLTFHTLPYKDIISKAYEDCMRVGKPTRRNLQGLFTWISKGHSRRGLERWSVPRVGKHRRWRQARVIHHVLKEQQEVKPMESVRSRMKRLRETSELYSLAAKNFAEALGKADEVAAKDVFIDDATTREPSGSI